MTGGFLPCDFVELGRETRNTELPSAFIPSVPCLFYYAFFVFYDHMKNTRITLIWCQVWVRAEIYKEYLEASRVFLVVFFFFFLLGTLLPSKAIFQVPVVLHGYVNILLNIKPIQYFLKWSLLIPQEYYRECRAVAQSICFFVSVIICKVSLNVCNFLVLWTLLVKVIFLHCLIALDGISDQDP